MGPSLPDQSFDIAAVFFSRTSPALMSKNTCVRTLLTGFFMLRIRGLVVRIVRNQSRSNTLFKECFHHERTGQHLGPHHKRIADPNLGRGLDQAPI